MANSDKNILITPSVGLSTNPTIKFTGANNTPTTLRVLDDGTVSFEATAGQLFSISDGLTGSIFSVNDISGIPSIEVLDTGLVKLNQYGGSTVFGTSTAIQNSSSVNAKVSISTVSATTPGLIIKAAASQSANLQEWQDNNANFLGCITSGGNLVLGASTNQQLGFLSSYFERSSSTGFVTLILQNYSLAGFGIKAGNAGSNPLVVKGAASQTANLTEWQNSSGTVLASISSIGAITTNSNIVQASSGRTFIGGSGDYSAFLNVSIPSAGRQGIVIRANASQSANLQEWQNSSGTVLSKINNDGALIIDTANTTSSGLIVKGVTGQTANVVEFWQNPTTIGFQIQQGTYPVFINNLAVGSNVYSNYQIVGGAISGNIGNVLHQFNSWNASWTTLGIRGAASQTGNLQEWQNSSGTALVKIDSGGSLSTSTNIQQYTSITSGTDVLLQNYYWSSYPNWNFKLFQRWSNNDVASIDSFFATTANGVVGVNDKPILYFRNLANNGTTNTRNFVGINTDYPKGQLHIVSDAAANRGLIIQGAASQTANLQEWQSSAGTVIAKLSSSGSFSAYNNNYFARTYFLQDGTTDASPQFTGAYFTASSSNSAIYARPISASITPLVIQGVASQTADLQQWQTNSGDVLATMTAGGTLVIGTSSSSASGIKVGSVSFGGISYNGISNPAGATTVPSLVIKGISSQTADLQQWHNSGGTAVASINLYGKFTTNSDLQVNSASRQGTTATAGWNTFATQSNSYASIGVIAMAGQTANLQEWQNSSGTVLTKVDSSGGIDFVQGGYVRSYYFAKAGSNNVMLTLTGDDNIQLGNGNMSGRSGANNIFIANATTVPSSNPSGGGVLYVENGALKYRGSSGTVTTIANA